MNALLKTGIKGAAAVIGAVVVGYVWDKYSGQGTKISIVPPDASGNPDLKAAGKLAGIVAAGAIVAGFAAKTLKINILK